jgi:hypothetical protein
MDFRRLAPRLEERILSLDRLHGSRTFLVIVRHVVDPRTHGIATHQPGVVGLQQIGSHTHFLHSGIEPEVVGIRIENHWHAVVDRRGHSVWGGCQKYSAVTSRIYLRSAGPLVFLGASKSIPTRVSGSAATRGIMLPACRCRVMNVTLLKTLVALVPACMLFSGSMVLSLRERSVISSLQLLGAGCLVLVVLTHVCEALHLVSLDALGLGA